MPGNFHFFANNIQDGFASFDEQETKHVLQILRYKSGDVISFTDGLGLKCSGEIEIISKSNFTARVLSAEQTERPSTLQLICGIIKSADRMEWMVEKCAELGVQSLCFVHCANSERATVNLQRLVKTAISALKQSHSNWLLQVGAITWKEVLQLDGNKFIAATNGGANLSLPNSANTICLVGPEGDFTSREMEEAGNNGYQKISFGSQILRTETAVIVAAVKFTLGNI